MLRFVPAPVASDPILRAERSGWPAGRTNRWITAGDRRLLGDIRPLLCCAVSFFARAVVPDCRGMATFRGLHVDPPGPWRTISPIIVGVHERFMLDLFAGLPQHIGLTDGSTTRSRPARDTLASDRSGQGREDERPDSESTTPMGTPEWSWGDQRNDPCCYMGSSVPAQDIRRDTTRSRRNWQRRVRRLAVLFRTSSKRRI